MGMNMSEKILARHAGLDHVEPGQLVVCQLDMVLANDVTGPPSIKEFEKTGRPVFDRTKIALIPDHFQPAKDIKSAELAKIMRDFARKHDILHYYEQGRVGIEHVILPERGIVHYPQSQGHLKARWHNSAAGRNPEAQFFAEKNPHYQQGDELVCLTLLDAGNLKSFALRGFLAGQAAQQQAACGV